VTAPRAITLDLDDTLWPIAPVIARAEQALHRWLLDHAPEVAHRFDVEAMRQLRDEVAGQRPDWAHDFTRIRHHSISLALQQCGHDPALADAAFQAFYAARNELELFPGVEQALQRLAERFPLLALTNGNADLSRLPIGRLFVGTVSAREFGVGKPDARIFHAACARLGCAPPEVLHVGDDWALDVLGARAAGMQVAWLRHAEAPAPVAGTDGVWVIDHLQQLVQVLITD